MLLIVQRLARRTQMQVDDFSDLPDDVHFDASSITYCLGDTSGRRFRLRAAGGPGCAGCGDAGVILFASLWI